MLWIRHGWRIWKRNANVEWQVLSWMVERIKYRTLAYIWWRWPWKYNQSHKRQIKVWRQMKVWSICIHQKYRPVLDWQCIYRMYSIFVIFIFAAISTFISFLFTKSCAFMFCSNTTLKTHSGMLCQTFQRLLSNRWNTFFCVLHC